MPSNKCGFFVEMESQSGCNFLSWGTVKLCSGAMKNGLGQCSVCLVAPGAHWVGLPLRLKGQGDARIWTARKDTNIWYDRTRRTPRWILHQHPIVSSNKRTSVGVVGQAAPSQRLRPQKVKFGPLFSTRGCSSKPPPWRWVWRFIVAILGETCVAKNLCGTQLSLRRRSLLECLSLYLWGH